MPGTYLRTYEKYAEVYKDWIDLYGIRNTQYLDDDNQWTEFTWKLDDHGYVDYEGAIHCVCHRDSETIYRVRGEGHPDRYFLNGKEIEYT